MKNDFTRGKGRLTRRQINVVSGANCPLLALGVVVLTGCIGLPEWLVVVCGCPYLLY